jgi:nucleoside-diphosphate-sugar epimerase
MNLRVKKIAILGATGHIAKNLVLGLANKESYELFLFARNLNSLKEFTEKHIEKNKTSLHLGELLDFNNHSYHVIINCIGIGDPAKLRKAGGDIFRLTENFDNLILDYLVKHPESLYINLSSGVAYGSNFSTPADQNKSAVISINNIAPTDYYTISKINTEAKHRAFSGLNIIDLRVFGFFSRFIDLKTPYFMSDLVNCILNKREFITGNNDMVRDYAHPSDLVHLIEQCVRVEKVNDVFDVYSLEPISKFQTIDYFVKHYDLKVNIESDNVLMSPTGLKSNYYSLNKKSEMIGYRPSYRSIESLTSELDIILNK